MNAPARPGALAQLAWVLRKDLLIEWRGRARLIAVGAYAVMVILLFSFAVGPDTTTLQAHAAGYVWLAVLSTSTMLLAQSFQVETEAGALEGLLLLPVDHRALFFGKAIANTAVLVAVAAVALPVGFVLFDLTLAESPLWLAVTVILGAAGLAAPGTLYAALTARLAAQQLMLPLLLFPMIVPALLSAVKATSLLLRGDPMGQVSSWLVVLACFNLIYWSLAGALFSRVVEE
ncbi:MAG: heme exporter protein CcmB [Alphaproteobacteria bacterium]|nr:heme exporter protein CcmB [Alphaproteobacteria bacterium]